MKRVLSLAVLLVVAACGASTTPPGPAPGGGGGGAEDACNAKSSAALDLVAHAIDANRACTKDSDCVIVALSAGCFDACGRSMASSGQAAYEKAVADANAQQCAAYKASGCPRVMPPPCAPNPPPTCASGVCS